MDLGFGYRAIAVSSKSPDTGEDCRGLAPICCGSSYSGELAARPVRHELPKGSSGGIFYNGSNTASDGAASCFPESCCERGAAECPDRWAGCCFVPGITAIGAAD